MYISLKCRLDRRGIVDGPDEPGEKNGHVQYEPDQGRSTGLYRRSQAVENSGPSRRIDACTRLEAGWAAEPTSATDKGF